MGRPSPQPLLAMAFLSEDIGNAHSPGGCGCQSASPSAEAPLEKFGEKMKMSAPGSEE